MNTPKVIRRNPRFGSAPYHDQINLHNNPNRHVPFAEGKDYIRADSRDKWAAVVMGLAVLIVVVLDSAWLMGWLR